MEPIVRRTAKGEARCTSPDGEKGRKVYLVKHVPLMRLTYQVRLLADAAQSNALTMVIVVPRDGRLSADLQSFVAARRWLKVKRGR